MRIIVRGFEDGVKVFEDGPLDVTDADVSALAASHIERFRGRVSMIEIEFPDEPEDGRFHRIGTDPRRMVAPLKVSVDPL